MLFDYKYLRTLVQCWREMRSISLQEHLVLYMNMYFYPLCNIIDSTDNKLVLYDNYFLSVMNPLHSHIVIDTYDNVNNIVTQEIKDKYMFTESPKELTK